MNNTPVDTRPAAPLSVHREDNRPPSRANESQRRAFEKLLSEDDEEADTEACADGGSMAPPSWLKEERLSPDDGLAATPSVCVDTPAATGSGLDIEVSVPHFSLAPMQQASLYPHLALPHGQSVEMGRFEVLDGSLVSGVDVNTTARGGITVTVGTSVQHVSLLDRYLPQLQRRLPEKVSAHVRVQEREPRRD